MPSGPVGRARGCRAPGRTRRAFPGGSPQPYLSSVDGQDDASPMARWTVRVRLTVLYAGAFLAAGVVLVSVTYGLVSRSLHEPIAHRLDLDAHDIVSVPSWEIVSGAIESYRSAALGSLLTWSLLALAGSLVALYFSAPWLHLARIGDVEVELFTGLLVYDKLTIFIRSLLLFFTVAFMVLTLLSGIPDREDGPDFYTLVLGGTVGMCLMASANHLLMIFLAIEMASLPSYAMAGFLKGRRQSSEAALKYVVYGSGAAGVMLYGASLIGGLLERTASGVGRRPVARLGARGAGRAPWSGGRRQPRPAVRQTVARHAAPAGTPGFPFARARAFFRRGYLRNSAIVGGLGRQDARPGSCRDFGSESGQHPDHRRRSDHLDGQRADRRGNGT